MKVRNGHVSNSSSSSFIIFGKPASPSEVTKEMLANKNIGIIGGELSDGTDFVRLDPEMLEFAQNNYSLNSKTWIEIASMHDTDCLGDEGVALPKTDKDLFVWVIEIDHHSADDIESLKRHYEEELS